VVKVKYIVAALIIIVGGIAIFFYVFESQEAKIKKQFKFIAEKIEKSPGESPIISGRKAKSIAKVFADPCFINIPVYDYSQEVTSESLSRYVFTMRSRYTRISMTFYDFSFEHMEKETARVTITAGIAGSLSTGETVKDIHEVTCSLKKSDDGWQFVKVEVVEVLKK